MKQCETAAIQSQGFKGHLTTLEEAHGFQYWTKGKHIVKALLRKEADILRPSSHLGACMNGHVYHSDFPIHQPNFNGIWKIA